MVQWVRKLLYSEDIPATVQQVEKIEDAKQLFVLMDNYNWDKGFDIPRAVLRNSQCTKGVALLTFYRADGYRFLSEGEAAFNQYTSPIWQEFITSLYQFICDQEFSDGNVGYTPELSNIQRIKLKKSNPRLPAVFLDGVEGEELSVLF